MEEELHGCLATPKAERLDQAEGEHPVFPGLSPRWGHLQLLDGENASAVPYLVARTRPW